MIKKLLLDLIILIALNNVIGKLTFSFKDINKIEYNHNVGHTHLLTTLCLEIT